MKQPNITITLSPMGEVGALVHKNGRTAKYGRPCARVIKAQFDDKTHASPFVVAPIIVGMLNRVPDLRSLHEAIFKKGIQYLIQVKVRGGKDYDDLRVQLSVITPDEVIIIRSNRAIQRYDRVPEQYRRLLHHKGVVSMK